MAVLIAPKADGLAAFPSDFGQRFWVTIDTEEDFDWTKPFSRQGHGLGSLSKLQECQDYFSSYGVAPIYLVDWPVIENADAARLLREWVSEGAAEVGAQLHPWVTPPFEEVVNARNSYTGNLPVALQRAKLLALRNRITDAIGVAPQIYRAGRYGLGPETAAILHELGFACDTSVRSGFDYRSGDGPDFRHMPSAPYWSSSAPDLLEVPLTTLFLGTMERVGLGEFCYHRIEKLGNLCMALAARAEITERVALTPEGIPVAKAIAAVDHAVSRGLPVLNFSFHSPSLEPGHTPYVKSADDVVEFYAWWDQILNRLSRHGVRPASASEVINAARAARE